MKAYQYFLFRIYMFYKDTMKEKDLLIFYTSIVSTVIIQINLLSVYFALELTELVPTIPNKYYIILTGVIIFVLNYYLIVRKKKFLDYSFEKGKTGGIITIGIFIITVAFAVIVLNIHPAKML